MATASSAAFAAVAVPARDRKSRLREPPAPTADGGARVDLLERRAAEIPGPVRSAAGSGPVPMSCCCARSMSAWRARGNRHTVADLRSRLGTGYVFGVEFVELGLGDARERAWHAGDCNLRALHGAAILSRHALAATRHWSALRPSGRWFDGQFDERRVGGRIALMAEIAVAGTPVLFVSAHYESHSDPADRLEQTLRLLDAIDAHAPGTPVLIAGDFNTSTFALAEKDQPAAIHAALAADPVRLVAPMHHEPMFDVLARPGYGWRELQCRVGTDPAHPTRRHAGAALRQDRLAVRPRPALHRSSASSPPSTPRASPSPTTRRWPSPSRRPEEAHCPIARSRPKPATSMSARHRGHSAGAPENTLPALIAAAAARCHGLRDRYRPDAGR